MTKQTKIKHYTKRDYAAFAYLAPWIIGMLVLQLYPFLSSLVYSFCNYKITGTPSFTGLNNYIQLFTMDTEFWNSLKVTLVYTLYTVPGKLVMALAVAVFLNRDIKGINLIRTLYYIPSLFGGSVAVAQFGSSMVMFLAALKNVPADLYEAAEIDGASKVKMFFSITVPQITPIIFFNLIMQTIQALQNFTSAFVITDGGPMKATYVLGMKLYKEGFSYFKMGYASAISWIIFIVIMLITLVLFATSKRWVFYGDES